MLLISIRSIIIRSFRCDKFLEVLKLISLIYSPNRSSNKENEAPEPHHDNHELLSARIGITASSATAQSQLNSTQLNRELRTQVSDTSKSAS